MWLEKVVVYYHLFNDDERTALRMYDDVVMW
jgi:hypothetical protein